MLKSKNKLLTIILAALGNNLLAANDLSITILMAGLLKDMGDTCVTPAHQNQNIKSMSPQLKIKLPKNSPLNMKKPNYSKHFAAKRHNFNTHN